MMRSECFDFGGLRVSVDSESQRFLGLVRERYGAFACRRTADWKAVYRLTDERVPTAEFLAQARQQPLGSHREGPRLRLTAPAVEMELDTARRTAELAGPLATFAVDRLIQALWYETRRGLILHAAALSDGERGWVAGGPSGCGKSTLAGLLPEHALCDEYVGVSLDGERPRLGALPFWRSRRGTADLADIYLLRHGQRDRRRRLTAGEAFARLRKEVLWPTFDGQAMRRAFDDLAELLDRVPIWELSFRPRPEVWNVIRREAAA